MPTNLPVDATDDIWRARCADAVEAAAPGLERAAVVAPEEASLEPEVVEDGRLDVSLFEPHKGSVSSRRSPSLEALVPILVRSGPALRLHLVPIEAATGSVNAATPLRYDTFEAMFLGGFEELHAVREKLSDLKTISRLREEVRQFFLSLLKKTPAQIHTIEMHHVECDR
jgi:hypothetical protein